MESGDDLNVIERGDDANDDLPHEGEHPEKIAFDHHLAHTPDAFHLPQYDRVRCHDLLDGWGTTKSLSYPGDSQAALGANRVRFEGELAGRSGPVACVQIVCAQMRPDEPICWS